MHRLPADPTRSAIGEAAVPSGPTAGASGRASSAGSHRQLHHLWAGEARAAAPSCTALRLLLIEASHLLYQITNCGAHSFTLDVTLAQCLTATFLAATRRAARNRRCTGHVSYLRCRCRIISSKWRGRRSGRSQIFSRARSRLCGLRRLGRGSLHRLGRQRRGGRQEAALPEHPGADAAHDGLSAGASWWRLSSGIACKCVSACALLQRKLMYRTLWLRRLATSHVLRTAHLLESSPCALAYERDCTMGRDNLERFIIPSPHRCFHRGRC